MAWPSSDPTARSSTLCSKPDIPVVVIASRHVKALRTRHGLAGNKDDRSDAFILADALRTDGHRLRPLHPDYAGDRGAAGDGPGAQGPRAARVALVQR